MDRISYLSTLPFLIPLQSKSWPPMMMHTTSTSTSTAATTTTNSFRSSQIILGVPSKKTNDYYSYRSSGGGSSNSAHVATTTAVVAQIPFVVSIELVKSSQEDDSKGDHHQHRVMYFSTAHKVTVTEEEESADTKQKNIKELDPTLTAIEMAVVQQPSSSSMTSITRTATSNPTATNHSADTDAITHVYIRIQEEHVFFFNTQYCHHVESQAAKTTNTNTNEDHIINTDQPQCLLLQFQNMNIQFRIFPWSLHHPHRDVDSTINNDDDVTEIFQQVRETFDSCRRQCHSIYPIKMEIAQEYRLSIDDDNDDADIMKDGPSSSTTTTTESSPILHNQQMEVAVVENDRTITKLPHNLTSKMITSVERKPPSNDENAKDDTKLSNESPHFHTLLQQYLHVRNQSLSSLNQIRHILHLPISTIQTTIHTTDSHDHDEDNDSSNNNNNNDNNNNYESSGSNGDNHHENNPYAPIRLTKASLPLLLNVAAQRMSQSYIVSDMDRPTIALEYDTRLQQLQQEQMNTVMNAYFLPSSLQHPHRHKRRKLQQQQQQQQQQQRQQQQKLSASMLSSSIKSSRGDGVASPTGTTTTTNMEHGTANPIDQPVTTIMSTDATINTMTTLMMEQKRLIQERYQSWLLPSRG